MTDIEAQANIPMQHCPDCGELASHRAAACPECGAPLRSDGWDAGTWLAIGAISAVVAWVAFAVVLGPVAVFAGYMAHKRGSTWGVVVALVGFVAFAIWAWMWLTVYGGGV